MKQLSLSRMVAVACILCASSAGASAAQHGKHGSDPARWYNGDSTQDQRLKVLKKELNAAYAEQTKACKKKSSSQRSACLKEARATYQHDSANARGLVANAPQSEITERVVSTTPARQDNTQDGASAYGSSGAAGRTGAGSSQPASGQQSDARQTGAEQSGAMGYGSSQSTGSSTPPVQSGTGATQSMGAGTGATQSDTQDQPRAGAVPPVQR